MNYITLNIKYLVDTEKGSYIAISERIGLEKGSLSKWYHGKSYPKIENIQNICSYFTISIDDFINTDLSKATVTSNLVKEEAAKYLDIETETGKALLNAINEHIDSKLEKTNGMLEKLLEEIYGAKNKIGLSEEISKLEKGNKVIGEN